MPLQAVISTNLSEMQLRAAEVQFGQDRVGLWWNNCSEHCRIGICTLDNLIGMENGKKEVKCLEI